MPGVPEVAGRRPVGVLGAQIVVLVGGGAQAQRQALRALAQPGGGDVEFAAAAVVGEGDVPVDGHGPGAVGAARHVPAEQVRDEMAQVLGQLGRPVGRVEGDVHARDGAGGPPVAGQAVFGGLGDHPAGDGVAAGLVPAAQFLAGRVDGHR